jgi:thioesterase III
LTKNIPFGVKLKHMEKLVSSKAKIRFQDCDPFNHLNNARYIDYMINAREDHLLEYYQLDVFKIAKTTGRGWVVASNQIAYISPAVTMETVTIESQLINCTSKTLQVEIKMWNKEHTKIKAVLWVKFIHVDLAGQKTVSHTDELMQLVNEILLPVEQTVFEERVKAILSNVSYK